MNASVISSEADKAPTVEMTMPIMLTEKEAAEFLQVARGTLSNARSRRDPRWPPYVKLPSGSIRYLLTDLNAYVASGRTVAK